MNGDGGIFFVGNVWRREGDERDMKFVMMVGGFKGWWDNDEMMFGCFLMMIGVWVSLLNF